MSPPRPPRAKTYDDKDSHEELEQYQPEVDSLGIRVARAAVRMFVSAPLDSNLEAVEPLKLVLGDVVVGPGVGPCVDLRDPPFVWTRCHGGRGEGGGWG
jgi:hypothetical protein